MSEAGVVDPDDAKLVTLARAARARNATAEGAAVRDDTGRTYVATTVGLPSLPLSALQAAVVMAVASGAEALEAAAVVTPGADVPPSDLAAVADLTPGAPVFVAGLDGVVRHVAKAP
jgi:hypothetical protein